MFQEKSEQLVLSPSSARDINEEDTAYNFDLYLRNIVSQMDRILMRHDYAEIRSVDIKTTLRNEETSFIIKNQHEYADAYSKLWESLKDTMPSIYGHLAYSPSEILCGAINCIQVLKATQKNEIQKITVNIKTSSDSEDKSSPTIFNYHEYIAAYYELWNLVRSTMPSTYENLIFLPPQIFCGAIECIQVLKAKKEIEFQKITVDLKTITDSSGYSSLIMRGYDEYAEANYRLLKLLRITMLSTYKNLVFEPSQILYWAIDCIQVLKSMQESSVTADIKISLYSKGNSPPIMCNYHEYIDAYYKLWNLLRDTKPSTYGNLMFAPLHIIYGAIDCIEELKKITVDIKTTLYSEDPVMENYHETLDAYYKLWKAIKEAMPIPYWNLRLVPLDIERAAHDCYFNRGVGRRQIVKKEKTD